MTQPLLLELPHVEPLAHFAYANGFGPIDSIVLSPDGSVAWFTSACPTIDIASALDLASRGLLYAQLAIAVLVLAIGLTRVLRRPRIPGHPHCRRCNYDLSGQSLANPCAECGVDPSKRPPIIGRTSKRRVRPWIIAVAILLTPALIHGGPATLLKKLCTSFAVSTVKLPSSLANRYPSLIKARVIGDGTRLFRADLPSGASRPLLTKRRTYERLVTCPDGQSLIMRSPTAHGVARVDGRTGRVIRQYIDPDYQAPGILEPLAIGFTPDGNGVFVQWELDRKKCGVSLWDQEKGSMIPVVSRDSWADAQGRRWASRFRLLADSPTPRVLEVPDFMQAYDRKLLVPTLHEAGSSHDWPAIRDASPDGQPAFSQELSLGFFSDKSMRAVIAINLHDGTEVGRLPAPGGSSGFFWTHFAFNESRKLLLVPVMQGGILIRDVTTKAWIGVLNTPEGTYASSPGFSADGTHVCATAQRNVTSTVGGKTAPTTEAMVWDISELLKGRGAGTP